MPSSTASRKSAFAPPKAANDNTSRHPDLATYLPALSWFYTTLSATNEPMGTAANDNDEPYPLSVPDRNPKLDSAERLIADWLGGGVRVSRKFRKVKQLTRDIEGNFESKPIDVMAGTITHIWGELQTQPAAKPAPPSRSKAAVAARKAEREWWTSQLGAQFAKPRKKLFKWRKKQPKIDWSQFAHVRGDVPLDKARAACGLEPVAPLPLGFPYRPHPDYLFRGMVTGRGAGPGTGQDGLPAEALVRRAHDSNNFGEDLILDRMTLEQFQSRHPDAFEVLELSASVGSFCDLVASNDNATGKRKYRRSAEALKLFFAA